MKEMSESTLKRAVAEIQKKTVDVYLVVVYSHFLQRFM